MVFRSKFLSCFNVFCLFLIFLFLIVRDDLAACFFLYSISGAFQGCIFSIWIIFVIPSNFSLTYDNSMCYLLLPFSVSFFGASHINMPLQEAKLSTNVKLKLRTRQPNALIFLTSGRTDHCLLTLNEGRVKLHLKINEYEIEVRWFSLDF